MLKGWHGKKIILIKIQKPPKQYIKFKQQNLVKLNMTHKNNDTERAIEFHKNVMSQFNSLMLIIERQGLEYLA